MLKFVYGGAGSGKTTYINDCILKDLQKGKKVMLLVPEQEAIIAEHRLYDLCDDISALNLEVQNFKRLSNHVFRVLGGLNYNYINKGGQAVVMWRALEELSPFLGEYKGSVINDRNFILKLLGTFKEFKAYKISPYDLETACDKLQGKLKSKVTDIALIYTKYEHLIHSDYDDASDDLTRLEATLEGIDFFKGYNVYLDSFYGFTPQEFGVLRQIMLSADNIVISLCMNPDNDLEIYDKIRKTKDKLIKTAKECKIEIGENIILNESVRFNNHELRFLEKYLWDFGTRETYKDSTDYIKVIECSDVYNQAEATARDILRRVRSGLRYRDLAVIVRETSKYDGIINTVFEKYGIPYHMSLREDLISKPLIKLILSALNIITYNWRANDVISYVKTGLANLDSDECDLIENYCLTWSIQGSRWIDDYEWNMNPDGFTEKVSEQSKGILDRVNGIRKRITEPLIKLSESFCPSCKPKEAATAIYNYLSQLDIQNKLYNENDIQLWNTIVDVLDQLALSGGDISVTCDGVSQLFTMIAGETDIGRIPSTLDEVVIGSAHLIRVDGIKEVYIIGVNDGEFPGSVSEDEIFNDMDKRQLKEAGIVLSEDSEAKNSEELFHFYNAVCRASDRVTILYYTSDLLGKTQKYSIACGRIYKLFPNVRKIIEDQREIIDNIEGYEASFEFVSLYKETKLGRDLLEYYSGDPEYKGRIQALQMPVSDIECNLDIKTAKNLFKGDLRLTQSRLDTYAQCNFSYFCKYVLKLSEQKRASFNPADVGNFIHALLERFMLKIKTEDGIRRDLKNEEIESMVDSLIDEHIRYTCGGKINLSKRLLHLFTRLRNTALLVIRNILDEFSESDFVPTFFELPIGNLEEEGIKPFVIPLPDNTNAYIYGKIDRVDIYRKGNDAYVRIVDYKTGTKNFSLSDIALGINLQMLLYLFSIWKNPEEFKKRINCSGDIYPAGVLYFTAKSPDIEFSDIVNEDDTFNEAYKKLTRKGILLDDPEILSAMEKNFESKYIPVSLNKDGSFSKSSSLVSMERFGSLIGEVSQAVMNLGMALKEGRASAIPIDSKKFKPCEYCKLKPICRINDEQS